MFLRLAAYLVFLVPILVVIYVASMAHGYKGPIVWMVVIGAIVVAAISLWLAFNVFKGVASPWSVATWIFLVIDICLVLATLVPWPWRR